MMVDMLSWPHLDKAFNQTQKTRKQAACKQQVHMGIRVCCTCTGAASIVRGFKG